MDIKPDGYVRYKSFATGEKYYRPKICIIDHDASAGHILHRRRLSRVLFTRARDADNYQVRWMDRYARFIRAAKRFTKRKKSANIKKTAG